MRLSIHPFAFHRGLTSFPSHPLRRAGLDTHLVADPNCASRRRRGNGWMGRTILVEPQPRGEQPMDGTVCIFSPFIASRFDGASPYRIVTTIISPTPLLAVNFIVLGRLIARIGPQYSRLSSRWCKPAIPLSLTIVKLLFYDRHPTLPHRRHRRPRDPISWWCSGFG